MNIEKTFYKWYKKICIDDVSQDQIELRWQGIQSAAEKFYDLNNLFQLIKIYFKLVCKSDIKKQFVECFSDIDKGFEESNEEEISLLAGCVLAYLLQGENAMCTALSLKIMEPFYDVSLKELTDFADDKFVEMTRDVKRVEDARDTWQEIGTEWKSELVTDDQFSTEAHQILADVLEKIQTNLDRLFLENQILKKENIICQERTQILSWIVGEWSDLLEIPLSEVKDINGSMVLGVELASLVKVYPGPYAAEAFLNRMLGKCEKSLSEVSLTDLIDSQEMDVKNKILNKYGDDCERKNMPIMSALRGSLTVEEKRDWLPAYRKAWKLNPDEIKMPLIKWTMLIYQECLLSAYYDKGGYDE